MLLYIKKAISISVGIGTTTLPSPPEAVPLALANNVREREGGCVQLFGSESSIVG